ncbi:MAG: hypothetical protein ACI4VN_02235 [Clostridia bacterium]
MKKIKQEKKPKVIINKEEHKARDLSIYIIVRTLVIITLIIQIVHKSWESVFVCILTLFLLAIPIIVDRKLNIELPKMLESIIILFIYAAEILGEIQNFYGTIPYWDTILHTINGFIMAGIGFSLIDILNERNLFAIQMSPVFVAIVAFCFSMTVGVMWEFFEYGADVLTKTDMQKDRIVTTISSVELNEQKENKAVVVKNIQETIIKGEVNGEKTEIIIPNGTLDIGIHDTMKDLIVNFIGATVFSILGYIYIKRRGKGSFILNFIPKLKQEILEKKKKTLQE